MRLREDHPADLGAVRAAETSAQAPEPLEAVPAKPEHQIGQLTTSELTRERSRLEAALRRPFAIEIKRLLRARLDAVLGEQAERRRRCEEETAAAKAELAAQDAARAAADNPQAYDPGPAAGRDPSRPPGKGPPCYASASAGRAPPIRTSAGESRTVPREPDVGRVPLDQLERSRRELAASLALTQPGALSAVTAAQLGAVERELTARQGEHSPAGVLLCSCGYGADNPIRLDAHLAGNPDHEPYGLP